MTKHTRDLLIIGTVAFAGGVAAGLLIAPKSGRENRRWLGQKAKDAGDHLIKAMPSLYDFGNIPLTEPDIMHDLNHNEV